MKVIQYQTNQSGQTFTREAYLKSTAGQQAQGSVLNRKPTDAKGYHCPAIPVLVIITAGSVTMTHWQDGQEVSNTFIKGDAILFMDWDLDIGEKEKRGHRSTPGENGCSQVNVVFADRAMVEQSVFESEAEALAA